MAENTRLVHATPQAPTMAPRGLPRTDPAGGAAMPASALEPCLGTPVPSLDVPSTKVVVGRARGALDGKEGRTYDDGARLLQ